MPKPMYRTHLYQVQEVHYFRSGIWSVADPTSMVMLPAQRYREFVDALITLEVSLRQFECCERVWFSMWKVLSFEPAGNAKVSISSMYIDGDEASSISYVPCPKAGILPSLQ